LIVHKESL